MSELNNTNQPVKYNGLAIASMVCGIVGGVVFCIPYISIILAVLAIIFGAVMINANKNNQDKSGRGMAIAGLILGIITIALDIFIIAGMVSVFSSLNSMI